MPTSLLRKALAHSNMAAAWAKVQGNAGAPGVDGISVESFAVHWRANTQALAQAVLGQRYHAAALREVLIPKPQTLEQVAALEPLKFRQLAIPTVADRVLQTAVALVLQPVLERSFADNSYAYRPGRGVQQAVRKIQQLRDEGYQWVVDADIEAFFDSIAHAPLLAACTPLLADAKLLHVLQTWLRAPLMRSNGQLTARSQGVPQGSPISPLLSNLYLDTLDDALIDANHRLVRFADDFVILCKTQAQAGDALNLTQEVLNALQLRLNSSKTRVVDFNQGFQFLGVNFVRSLAVPAAKAKPRFAFAGYNDAPLADTAMNEALRESNALTTALEAEPTAMAPEQTNPAEVEQAADVELDDAPADDQHLTPPSPQPKPQPLLRSLYLLEQGAEVSVQGDELHIEADGETLAQIGLPQIDMVLAFGGIQFSTQALQACLKAHTPVLLLAKTGKPYGAVLAPDATQAATLRAQVRASDGAAHALDIAQAVVRAKLINSRVQLKRWARSRKAQNPAAAAAWHQAALQLRDASWRCKTASTHNQLRGFEGAGAAAYFGAWRSMLADAWQFKQRVAWPPPDPINTMLSFGYSLLRANALAMLLAEGLNPQIGFLHADGHAHAALASDLMEPFRALVVDATVMELLAHKRIKPQDFDWQHATPATGADVDANADADTQPAAAPPSANADAAPTCSLKTQAARLFIHAFEERMQQPLPKPSQAGGAGQATPSSWRHAMLQQTKSLALHVRHGHPFEPFVGR